EMVVLLWKDGNVDGAVALEDLWNGLAAKYSFSLLCAYSMGNFYMSSHAEQFRKICAQHTHISPAESFRQADDVDRLKELALLQQRNRALEAEVSYHRNVEVALLETLEQRRAIEEALRTSESKLRDFLDRAPEGIHWV